ncbi:methyl-accepting chemotaxis protein [Hungatella sp.]|uniref:methyl-accepting chemotaxis protein n=1 Tax=Hungatella sp. TaxID=2613924 RepID=UPI002A805489|nr:methyl-accepting chemotaxis protein [Hungatella sp.]
MLKIVQNNKVVENLENEKTILLQAEIAHYEWKLQLNDAVNCGIDFKGQKDPTKCTFGQYIYTDIKNDPDMQKFYQQAEPAHRELHALADKALKLSESNRNEALEFIRNDVDQSINSLSKILNKEISVKSAAVQAQFAAIHRLLMVIVIISLCAAVIIVFSVFNTYIYIEKKVIKPIAGFQAECRKLSEGKLDLIYDTRIPNEIGELGAIMNRSIGEIQTYIKAIEFGMTEFSKGNFTCVCPIQFQGDFVKIQRSIESFQKSMNDTLLQIDMAADQVEMGAVQVSNASQILAQGAAEQAASVEELSAAASGFTRQITSNAEYSQQMNGFGKQSGEMVKKSQMEMEQMVNAIQDIAKTSKSIRNIIKTIDDIAFQTNILALNAAVEAARAGKAGKGFAVVADEVRNLAQKSAEAAQSTNLLIESSLLQIVEGEKLANRSYRSFSEVAGSAAQILEMIEKVSITSQDQSEAINRMSQELKQISSIIQTNSATSQESAATSEELGSQSVIMKKLIMQFQLNRS